MATHFDIHIPFVEHLGIQLIEKADGRVSIRLDPRPEHLNSWKGVHGGVLMSLLDVSLSSASRALDPACIGASTVEIKVNFLAVATGSMLSEAHAQRAGRSLIFCEGAFKLIYP
jgi:uncharacterized protein (TIGR00369 family)